MSSAGVRVVTNRVFLLGLGELYREAMKRHERGELLRCAEEVARTLNVPPARVPVEGYYSEEPELTQYFRLLRAIQALPIGHTPKVASLAAFKRLYEVVSSPIYGRAQQGDSLLPTGDDPLSVALQAPIPSWAAATLTEVAARIARDTRDISLVGLAARSGDAVVLAALAESVVLYRTIVTLGLRRDVPEYRWEVDDDIAEAAGRFIETFNALFDETLPAPAPDSAAAYWNASDDLKIFGRCVRLGQTPGSRPLYYHWAIRSNLTLDEFWDPEIWTTERYRASLFGHGAPPARTHRP